VKWRESIDLAEALLGLPGRRPGQYEDVTKLARIGTLVGLGGGLFAAGEGGGFWCFCATIFAGCLLGGIVALWLKRIGVPPVRLSKTTRNIEIAGCIGCAVITALGVLVSIFRPTVLGILATLLFAWGTVRYFHRQQALARSPESLE
jgi:hypothetical protein